MQSIYTRSLCYQKFIPSLIYSNLRIAKKKFGLSATVTLGPTATIRLCKQIAGKAKMNNNYYHKKACEKVASIHYSAINKLNYAIPQAGSLVSCSMAGITDHQLVGLPTNCPAHTQIRQLAHQLQLRHALARLYGINDSISV